MPVQRLKTQRLSGLMLERTPSLYDLSWYNDSSCRVSYIVQKTTVSNSKNAIEKNQHHRKRSFATRLL